ncbi:MAG: hypothetical protein B2I17_03405 [Thermoplasmatales archaeon B_DKE]|nr:MAG: hypothetical protein B2I17_03405 [Thermoplasmatales archaeon B_DKE]
MGVTISVTVVLPDGNPASGSDITFLNNSAIFKGSKNWTGTTGKEGTCIWNDMDKGNFGLGDIYVFQANYMDPTNGKEYIGNKTVRIKRDQNVLINLREAQIGETFYLKISNEDLSIVSTLPEGDEIVSVIKELAITTKNKLSHASVMLETYIVESFIRARLKQKNNWNDSFEKLPLGALLKEDEVKKMLGTSFSRRVSILNDLRIAAVHPKGVGTYFEESSIGLGLIKDLISDWFRST